MTGTASNPSRQLSGVTGEIRKRFHKSPHCAPLHAGDELQTKEKNHDRK
jgi:hypothetical protein